MKHLLAHPSTRYYLQHPLELWGFSANLATLTLRKKLGDDVNLSQNPQSTLPIEIVMPTLDRDYPVVTRVIDSLKKNIKHPVGQIIIISPPSSKIEKMCLDKKCEWINENNVLPITIKDIHVEVNGINRSGWIFQQLLKWAADQYIKTEYFLITESDTVYARPHVFEHNGRSIFACSTAPCHIPYFRSYQTLFKEKAPATHNLTSHHLLFKKSFLAEAKAAIEKNHHMPWYEAIIANLDLNELSSVSDYDSYGQFVLNHHPETVTFEHWANRSFGRSELEQLPKLIKEYAPTTKTLSFHSYDE